LKGNAFSVDTIDSSRRYEIVDPNNPGRNSQFTCVEPPKQNDPNLTPVKSQSAGSNILSLEKKSPDKPLTRKLNFEEIAPEGYKDDDVVQLRTKDYWKAVRSAAVGGDTTELDRQTASLFVGKFGPFSSSDVITHFADILFTKEKA
jgi:hypothetical protein